MDYAYIEGREQFALDYYQNLCSMESNPAKRAELQKIVEDLKSVIQARAGKPPPSPLNVFYSIPA
jgi:hypothetical protein